MISSLISETISELSESNLWQTLERLSEKEVNIGSEDFDYRLQFRVGSAAVFGSAAYWIYQWHSNPQKIPSTGRTLLEEVVYCMLGGFGISGEMSNGYYEKIKNSIASFSELNAELLEILLREPIFIFGKPKRYRYPKQKSRLISAAVNFLVKDSLDDLHPLDLRDKLLEAPGIGLKTASWIVRNFLGSDEVAILDIHLHRAGLLAGFFRPEWTPTKHYTIMEDAYLKFSKMFHASPAGLDLLMWNHMRIRKFNVANGSTPLPKLKLSKTQG
jgi:thermostable 8-oxoguanine DNA glycosylase